MAEVGLRELKPDTFNMENSSLDDLVEAEQVRDDVTSPEYVGLFSFFIMGLGQLYNGQRRAAKVFFGTQLCLLLYIGDYFFIGDVSTTVIGWTSPFTYGFLMSILIGGGFVVWLFNVYDAYSTAKFCEMIYDRTLPNLDDEEEELLASHLRMATFGTENSSGYNRKLAFGAAAVFVYSASLFLMGSYFNGSSDSALTNLRANIAANGNDTFSHLQLGELLLAGGSSLEASLEFRKVISLSEDPASLCAAYTALARIHKRMGDEVGATEMLQKAAKVASTGYVATSSKSGSNLVKPSNQQTPPHRNGLTTKVPVPATMAVNSNQIIYKPVSPVVNEDKPIDSQLMPLSSPEIEFAFDRVETELSIGNVKLASSILKDLSDRGCDTASFWAWNGRMYLAAKDYRNAKSSVKKALAKDSREPEALRVQVSLAIGESKDAMLSSLKAYTDVVPGDPLAAIEVSSALYKGLAYKAAYEVVSDQLVRTPHSNALMVLAFKIARDDGRQSQAYEAAKAIVDGGIQNVAVCHFLALEEEKLKNYDNALKHALSLSVLEPGKTKWLVFQGKLLFQMRDYSKSIAAYKNALAVDGRSVNANLGLAETARVTHDYDLALSHLQIASSLAPDNIEIGNEMGKLAIDMGDFEAAEDAYRRVINVSGDSLDARYSLGFIMYSTQRFDEAISLLQKVYVLAPSYKDVAWYLGCLYNVKGDRAQALKAFKSVENASIHFNEANIEIEKLMRFQHSPPLATVNTTAKATGSKPPVTVDQSVSPERPYIPVEQYSSILEAAELAFRDGRNEDALQKYNEVLAIIPDHFRSLFQKGIVLYRLGKHEEAVPVLKKVCTMVPSNLDALMELGNVYADLGRYDEAIAEFEEVIRSDPKHLSARYNLGWLFEKQKKFDNAQEQYKAIVWFYPEYIKAYDSLGNLYFSQAKYEDALLNFDKILSVDHDDITIRFKAALTLLQLGRSDRARRELMFLKSTIGTDHPLYAKVNDYLGKLG